MDLRLLSLTRVEHRHGDDWYPMEEQTSAHRPADAEREWRSGRVYLCRQCDESVRVVHDEDARDS